MYKIFFTILLILTFESCARDPHSVGSSLLGPDDEAFQLFDTTLTAYHDTTFTTAVLNGGSYNLLVGDSDSLETQILIKFSNELADSLQNVKFDTILITLTPNYRWNVKLAQPTFEIGVLQTQWYDTTTKSNELFLNPTSVAKTFTDSMLIGKQVKILLDSTFIAKWKNSKSDSLVKDWGFVIKAKSKQGIIGFSSFNGLEVNKPTLIIKYKKQNLDSTFSISTSIGNDTYLSKSKLLNKDFLIVQGAIHQRTRIAFNLKSLGKFANINNATLELTAKSKLLGSVSRDSLQSFLSFSKDSLKVDSTSYLSIFGRNISTKTDSSVYSFNVTYFAQQFVRDSLINNGFIIKTIADVELADRFIFYNRNSASNLKPRLKVIYSLKK